MVPHNEDFPDLPPVRAQDKAWLELITPVTYISGVAVVTAQSQLAKEVVERKFSDAIAKILASYLKQPVTLAISVSSTPHEESTAPSPSSSTSASQSGPTTPSTHDESNSVSSNSASTAPEDRAYKDFATLLPPPPPRPRFSPDSTHHDQPEASEERHSDTRGETASSSNYDDKNSFTSSNDIALYRDDSDRRDQLRRTTTLDSDHHAWRSSVINAEEDQTITQRGYTPPHEVDTSLNSDNSSTHLNPNYTFDTFVTGSSNRYAHAVARAVAEYPAEDYNPLFIWGNSGLGKTHLMHAIGHYAKQLNPVLRIRYVSSEEFTNDWINSIRDKKGEQFKRRYRQLDILIVDDIQFLAGKEGTQEEFFHTFNALHQANKQIVLSSDRPPRDLTTLESRLRTRFQAGMITDIQAPDPETCIAILELKARRDGCDVPREVLDFIVQQDVPSVRELEGMLTRVAAIASLDGAEISLDLAKTALNSLVPSGHIEITASTIMTVTAEYFDVSIDDLTGPKKVRPVVIARQIAMYLCRELTDMSLPKIGEAFGGRDHTTAMYAERKIRKQMNEDRKTYNDIEQLTNQIKTRSR